MAQHTLFIITIGMVSHLQLLAEESPPALDDTTIQGLREDTLNSLDKTTRAISKHAGAASKVTPDTLQSPALNASDIFEFNPSVNAEQTGVGNDTRLSIRGSAAQSQRINRGTSIYYDGIPGNSVDGAVIPEGLDPLHLQYSTVFPGSNGFYMGSNQFGGAIDFRLKNGLSHPGLFFQTEYGSYETLRSALQYGYQNERLDAWAGYTHGQSDGYRDHSSWQKDLFSTNLGYKWNDTLQSRLYFTATNSDAELPGNLTPEEFEEDPQQRQDLLDDSSNRDASLYRVAQSTAWQSDTSSAEFYAYFQRFDVDDYVQVNRTRPMRNSTNLDLKEFGVGTRVNHDWKISGIKQSSRAFLSFDYGENTLKGDLGPRSIDQDDEAQNLMIYLENETEIRDSHYLTLGAGWINARRKHNNNTAGILPMGPPPMGPPPMGPPPMPPNLTPDQYSENQDGGIWRVGYLYELNKKNQFFANVSQSFEAAPFSVIDNGGILSPQKSISYEVGSRFEHAWLKGSFTAYYTEIDGEYVSAEVFPNSNIYQFTNEDTVHRGIEATLRCNLTEALNVNSEYKLSWNGTYRLNDFYFESGEFEGNKMPGVSPHVYSSRIQLKAPSNKWNLGLSVRYQPEGVVIDNANTASAPGYAAWRLSSEYVINSNLSCYGGIDNLFDKEYIRRVAINPRRDNYITPGNGRSAYLGFKVIW